MHSRVWPAFRTVREVKLLSRESRFVLRQINVGPIHEVQENLTHGEKQFWKLYSNMSISTVQFQSNEVAKEAMPRAMTFIKMCLMRYSLL